MALRAILFDLDGTLVQTREASWQLFERTNREFSLGIDDRAAFFDLFHDNFFRALAARCPDREKLQRAKQHFLDLLRTQYTPPLVPGLADVVRTLASRSTLVVLSTNTIATIRRILTEAGISNCFAHVFAGDVEPDKSVSMHRFLDDPAYGLARHCTPAYDESNGNARADGDIVLVTDTVGDVKEARSAGVRAIGVAWGMHSEAELLAAGAETVAVWPQELIAWLAPEGMAVATACATPAPGVECSCPLPAACACHEPGGLRGRVAAVAGVRRTRRLTPQVPALTPAPPADPPATCEPELLATLRLLHAPSGAPALSLRRSFIA